MTSVQYPGPRADRVAAALLPFVQRWDFSVNPEDLELMVHAVLRHVDAEHDVDAVVEDVHRLIDEHAGRGLSPGRWPDSPDPDR